MIWFLGSRYGKSHDDSWGRKPQACRYTAVDDYQDFPLVEQTVRLLVLRYTTAGVLPLTDLKTGQRYLPKRDNR